MNKVAVIYWSGTGNTEMMANAVAEGAREAGADVKLFSVSDITAQEASQFERLALGCPAMGAENLEESEFEPFFTELEPSLKGKKVALFGSYGWGGGTWLEDWQARTEKTGAYIVNGEGVKANEQPTDEALSECKALGKSLAS